MMPQLPVHQAYAMLGMHARINVRLDELSRKQRDILERIEEREILAYNDPARFAKLEALKQEVLSIRFLTDPSP